VSQMRAWPTGEPTGHLAELRAGGSTRLASIASKQASKQTSERASERAKGDHLFEYNESIQIKSNLIHFVCLFSF